MTDPTRIDLDGTYEPRITVLINCRQISIFEPDRDSPIIRVSPARARQLANAIIMLAEHPTLRKP